MTPTYQGGLAHCAGTVLMAPLATRVRTARHSPDADVLSVLSQEPTPEVLDALVGNPALPARSAAALLRALPRDHHLLPALSRHAALSLLPDDELERLDGTPLLVLNPHLDDDQVLLLDSDPLSAAVLAPEFQPAALARALVEAGVTAAVPVPDWRRLNALASNERLDQGVADELLGASADVDALLAANDALELRVQMPLFAIRMRRDHAALEAALDGLNGHWRRVARGFDGALGELLESARAASTQE